mgnify:CR=1 FL=1
MFRRFFQFRFLALAALYVTVGLSRLCAGLVAGLAGAALAAVVLAARLEKELYVLAGLVAGFGLAQLVAGALPRLVAGLRSAADIDGAFGRGAAGVIGWPMQGAYEAPANAPRSEIQAE